MVQLLLFFIASFFAFFVPGTLVLYPLKLKPQHTYVIGTSVGIALWAIQGYIFGFLSLRPLSYAYLIISFAVWVFLFILKKGGRLRISDFKKFDFVFALIVVVGVFINISSVWNMGVMKNNSLMFCCRGVPDAIYHLSLTDSLVHNFPPKEPGAASLTVKNYHFLSNLVAADLIRVFKLDLFSTQFRGMSLLVSVLLGLSAWVIGDLLNLGRSFKRWFAVFLYGCGDILYLLLFLRGKGFDFSVTILDDATKLLAGPPRAYSILILFGGICLLLVWINQRKFFAFILSGIILGTLVGFKIYTGIFALSGLGSLTLYEIYKRRFQSIFPVIIAGIISAAYFFQFTDHKGKFYFFGMWKFIDFVENKNLAISKLDYMRLSYLNQHQLIKTGGMEIVFVLLYFIFLFGTVNIGFLQTKKSMKLFPLQLHIFLIPALMLSLTLGIFFRQDPGNANTVQFTINAFIIASIYSALAIFYWQSKLKKPFVFIFILIIFAFTTLRAFHEGYQNLAGKADLQMVKADQIEALSYLKSDTPKDSLIMVDPHTVDEESLMFVTFLAERPIYLVGYGILKDHGQDADIQKSVVEEVYYGQNQKNVQNLLRDNNVSYMYVPPGVKIASSGNDNFLTKIFSKNDYEIYKVN